MGLRLIRWQDRERQGISFDKIESPFFAVGDIRKALSGPSYSTVVDLNDFLHAHGVSFGRITGDKLRKILKTVEDGQWLLVKDAPFSPLSHDTSGRYSRITGKYHLESFHSSPPVQEKPRRSLAESIVKPEPQEPGFYVAPKSTTRDQLEATLFTARNPAVMSKFQSLNPNLSDVKAGSMIVLSDPNNLQCTREEALLMAAAAKTNDALKPLSTEEADFMAQHRDEIQAFLAHSSTTIGVGTAMFGNNLENVTNVLSDIESLHKRAFQVDGHLRSPEFLAERKRLFAQLDTNLTALTRIGVGFPDHPNLKSALGISSRSLVHRWTKAGAAGQIPGYATHIDGVAKTAQIVKNGGKVGAYIGAGVSAWKVQEVCTTGNTQACKRVALTEVGSVTGGVIGGYVAGAVLTAKTVGGLCVVLGVPTGGVATLVCGLVVVAAGSLAAGTVVGGLGGQAGELIYEATK